MSEHSPIKRMAFVVNESKAGAADLAERLRLIASDKGIEIKSTSEFPVPDGFLKDTDACCVIGGDGTFLSAAHEATRWQVPLVGVNRGTLGFLTTYAAEDVASLFPDVLGGDYRLTYRSLLECRTGGEDIDFALNDVVIKGAEHARIVHVNVFANEEFITTYVCDGLIFSTPTGSTAYTLSAGGPLIHPNTEVVSLTPICPHTLSNRSIIFPQNVKLRVENADTNAPLMVAIDGQRNMQNCELEPIKIQLSQKQLPIAQKLEYSHFDVVRSKLKWNGGYAGDI